MPSLAVFNPRMFHTHARTHAHAHTTHTGVQEKQRLEVQLDELQTSMLNPMEEQKLRKQLKKSRVLIKDLQQELDYTRESGRNSTALRSLRHQLEEKEDIENSLNKTIKKLNAELAETQELNEDLERKKGEVEAKVSELTREKNELELRCEEEQDEVEEMAEKQRQYATKVSVSGTWTACGPGLTHHHQWWADDFCVPVYQLWASRTLREPLVCLICWCLYCMQFEGHGVLLLHLVSHSAHTLARIHTFGHTFMHPLLLMLQHTHVLHTYIHIHTHTYTYIHIHTYVCMCMYKFVYSTFLSVLSAARLKRPGVLKLCAKYPLKKFTR